MDSVRQQMLRLAALLVIALSATGAAGQAPPPSDMELLNALSAASPDTPDLGPLGIIPLRRGFNASFMTTSQHDAASEWSWLVTPVIAYRFNRHFSVDASTPLYLYIGIFQNVGTSARPVYNYSIEHALWGDTQISLRHNWSPRLFDYSGSISLGVPSGNDLRGLGAGQPTYDINNHFERRFWRLLPEIELGEGNTSTLVDPRIRKSYVAVGQMAHFQAGFGFLLPHNLVLDAQMYEQLPLAKDLVYSTTGKGKKKVTTATNIGPAEDNGLLSSLDIPMSPHLTLSGFYNRSIRDGDDLTGFSITYLLRAVSSEK